MHFHFPFTANDILWTLTFAAQLVLLVVLMGRERIARFPWFTTSIALIALRLLTAKLLFNRLPQMTMATIFIVIADVGVLVGMMVLLELARRAFGTVRRSTWLASALTLLALGAVVLKFWGPWPSWATLTAQSSTSGLQFLQLAAQKGSLFVDVETVMLGALVVLLGRRFRAGWRSHTQQVMIGLATASSAQLVLQAVLDIVSRTAKVSSMEEYNRLLGFRDRLLDANGTIYVVVLVWWIVCLWNDEPVQSSAPAASTTAETESGGNEAGGSPAVEAGS